MRRRDPVRRIPRTSSRRRSRDCARAGCAGGAARRPAAGGDVGHAGRRKARGISRCAAAVQRRAQLSGTHRALSRAPRRGHRTSGQARGGPCAGRTSGRCAGVSAGAARDRQGAGVVGACARRIADRNARAARRASGGTAVARAAAVAGRPASRGAGHQRRRIQRHPARRARGDRQRSGARAALRPEQRFLAVGCGQHRAIVGGSARRSRRPRRRGLGLPAVAGIAAAGTAAAAGDRAGRTCIAGAGARGLGQRRPAFRRCAAGRCDGRRARTAAAPRCAGCGPHDQCAGTEDAGDRHPSAARVDAAVGRERQRDRAGLRHRRAAGSARPAARGSGTGPQRCAGGALAGAGRASSGALPAGGRALIAAGAGCRSDAVAAASALQRQAAIQRASACIGRSAGARVSGPHRLPTRQRSAPLSARQRPHGAAVRRQRDDRRAVDRRLRSALRSEGRESAARRAGRRNAVASGFRRAVFRSR